MNYQHKQLANGRWRQFTLMQQLANIGSEVFRALKWKEEKNKKYAWLAFERTLELIDLTINDPKNKNRLKEILRMRECLADYFVFDNKYRSTKENWQKYFYAFNFAVATGR